MGISIHQMLMFNNICNQDIVCYQYFNTSNVNVQLLVQTFLRESNSNFNTSNVNVQPDNKVAEAAEWEFQYIKC